MDKIKNIIKEGTFMRGSVFIVFNALLLYVLYYVIHHFGDCISAVGDVINVITAAFTPLIIGLILAYLLDPLVDLIDSKIMSRAVNLPDDPLKSERKTKRLHLISVLIMYILVIAALLAIIYAFTVMLVGKVIIGSLSGTLDNFIGAISSYESGIRQWITHNLPDIGIASYRLSNLATSIMTWLSDNFTASTVLSSVVNLGGSIVSFVIGIIVSIYLMTDKKMFLGLWRKFLHLTLSQKHNAQITETLSEINGVISGFVRGAMLDALIIAVISSISLSVLGLKGAVFVGVFAGIANVIPYFGPIIGMVPAFLMGLCTDGLWQGIIAVVILIVIQQIDANIIYPKIVGKNTGLHPLFVLLAVSVLGYFWGILGMLIAVPIAGIIQLFVVKWATRKELKISSASSTGDSSKDDTIDNVDAVGNEEDVRED